MPERTKGRDSTFEHSGWPELLEELNHVRLSRDWSYRELEQDIERITGLEISYATLQSLLSVPADQRTKPFDRTLYKIRQYLDALKRGSKRASA